MLGKIKSTLFGGTKPVSTLTPAQRELLSQLGGLQQDYNPSTYAGLAGIAGSPDSAYKYDAEGMQNAFKQGVFNPAMQQLNQQLGATKHSSSLHSSANRYAQDQLRQNIMNNLNYINWQNLLRQQEMEQQGQENAYARQMQALKELMKNNQAVLGTKGTALQKTGGLLDVLTAVGGAARGIGSIMGGIGTAGAAAATTDAGTEGANEG